MNLEETITLIECLKESGAVHFKSRDLEVSFVQSIRPDVKRQSPRAPQIQREAAPKEEAQETLFQNNRHHLQPGPAIGANAEDTEKAKELIATLRNPEKLMDVIFPEGAGG